ncbi:DUF1059 domain-containing protein [Dactylosporangium sp. NPDC051484]
MKTSITCPCGTVIKAETEDELVEKTQAHLQEAHNRMYSREEILFMAI